MLCNRLNIAQAPSPNRWVGVMTALIISFCWGFATASLAQNAASGPTSSLIGKSTSGFLQEAQWKLGLQSEYGISHKAAIGVDISTWLAGAANLYARSLIWSQAHQSLTAGIDVLRMSRDSIFWGTQREKFARLNVNGLHPRLVFSHAASDRLIMHSSWEVELGFSQLELSAAGKERLWHKKYPDEDYSQRDAAGHPQRDGSRRVAENLQPTHQALLLQSLLGLAKDRFELTGEIQRSTTETIIVSAHVARFQVEDLKAQRFGCSLAQQWRGPNLGFRAGIGLLYQVASGTDLDGERVDDARFLPTGDLDLFFIL